MDITNATVAGLKLATDKTDQCFWDDTLKGFGLRLRLDRKGVLQRSFIIQYRNSDGQQRRMRIKASAADKAREKAAQALHNLKDDEVDPQAKKDEKRTSSKLPFEKAVAEYLEIKARELRPSSLRHSTMYLTGSYFKVLHKMPLTKIGRSHVSSAVNKITTDSGAAAAGRARAHLSAFFTWCLQQGHCGDRDNPVADSANPKANDPRDRVLENHELVAVWNACGDDDYGKIIRLLILTGCRREEIGGLRWSEIDLDACTIKLPADRVKNHRAHTLPLVPMAMDIIRLIPQRVGRDHLFGDRSPKGFSKWGQCKAASQDGVVNWRPHDLRRTLTTQLCDLGVEPHIVEAITNHQSGHKSGIAGTYNYAKYPKQMKAALNIWADHIRSLVEENERKVVSFKQPA